VAGYLSLAMEMLKLHFGDLNFLLFGWMFRSNQKKFWVGKILGFYGFSLSL
jgi:hypothetical protein